MVLGLGNPGPRFAGTRHNVGFAVAELLAESRQTTFRKPVFRPYSIARDAELALVRPLTYMNRSGSVLAHLFKRLGINEGDLTVVVDNMDLPVGSVRLKRRGSSRSHNGIASIMDVLGNGDFLRVYVGIGRPADGVSVVDHVLGVIPEDETTAYISAYRRAAKAIEMLTSTSVEEVQNTLHSSS